MRSVYETFDRALSEGDLPQIELEYTKNYAKDPGFVEELSDNRVKIFVNWPIHRDLYRQARGDEIER